MGSTQLKTFKILSCTNCLPVPLKFQIIKLYGTLLKKKLRESLLGSLLSAKTHQILTVHHGKLGSSFRIYSYVLDIKYNNCFSLFAFDDKFQQEGLAQVAYIDCSSKEISCKKIGIQSGTVFLPAGNSTLEQGQEIHSLNYQEIATQVLEQLPDAQNLEDADVEVTI